MQHLLIVEDSIEFQKIISRVLNDYELTSALSAEEAWTQLGTAKFALVLLDISLPGKDGYSLLADMQASELFRNIPVICLTGKVATSDRVNAFRLGADDFIEKPFDHQELKVRVAAKLAKSLSRTAHDG
ncbi:MAG: response regulator [Cryobacterium sp.]|nr:response regulator [Oligoflexia bacterium]